jgi:sulfonate transport system substrate-binding protein
MEPPAPAVVANDSFAVSSPPASGQRASTPTVRIGCQKFGLLMLLRARGALDRALARRGVEVEWSEFPGGLQLVDALQAGRLDLGVVGEGPAVFALAARAPLVYLAAEPPAPEGEAIIVHHDSRIRTVAELKGRTVALNKGANVDYLLIRALEEAELRYEDVNVVFLPPSRARAAFENREVDAWAIWNPVLASVRDATRARVLRDAKGLAANTAFYIGTREFADAHSEVVELFLAEVTAVGHWANQNTDGVAELLGPSFDISKRALIAALRRSPFGARPLDADLVASQQAVAEAFLKRRLIPQAISVSEAQWTPPSAQTPFRPQINDAVG